MILIWWLADINNCLAWWLSSNFKGLIMKKILIAILASSSISAFADIGDTPYTLAQEDVVKNVAGNCTYFYANIKYKGNDLWIDGGGDGFDAGLDSGNTPISFSKNGVARWAGVDQNWSIGWCNIATSTTSASIMNRIVSYASNVGGGLAYSYTGQIIPVNSGHDGNYFMFPVKIKVDGSYLKDVVYFTMTNNYGANNWGATTNNSKQLGTNAAKNELTSAPIFIKSENNKCYSIKSHYGAYNSFDLQNEDDGKCSML